MDDFSTHLRPYLRRFPHLTPVQSIGYISHKKNWIDHAFDSLNFSFVLRGTGEYRIQGKTYPVEAPCVITQWPGIHVHYGPWSEWEELYLIYPQDCQSRLEAQKLAQLAQPLWYIRTPGPTRRKLAELKERLAALNEPGCIDAIDRICEALIVESHLGEQRRYTDENEETIARIRAHMEEHYLEVHDFEQLALYYGMSPTSFRRHWSTFVGVPPARYCMQLRLRQACRLLVETRQSVGDIAASLRFDDPLYFSRRFRQLFGVTASHYRKLHQTALSMLSPPEG